MDTINKNLRYLRKHAGMTQQEFAAKLGIKRSLIGAYEEGRAKPNMQVQLAICKLFGITLDQLHTEDLKEKAEQHLQQTEKQDNHPARAGVQRILSITVDRQGEENIELVSQKAAAGYTSGYADPEFIAELPKFRLPFLPAGTYRAFEIAGDSMLPLQPGTIVIGEYVDDWTSLRDGYPYIVVTRQDGIVFKRVFNRHREKGVLVLRSDNPSYPPYEISTDDVLEIWSARLYISKAVPEVDITLEKLMAMLLELQQEVIRLKSEK